MTTLFHRRSCTDITVSSSSSSIRSCFSRRLCFHTSDKAASLSKLKLKNVTRIEETKAFDTPIPSSHDVALLTNACKSVALATEQTGNVYAAVNSDCSHEFNMSETDLFRLQKARLAEMERFLINHDGGELSHGNQSKVESSHGDANQGDSSRGNHDEDDFFRVYINEDQISHCKHDENDSSNETESSHDNHDGGGICISSHEESESSHVNLDEDNVSQCDQDKGDPSHDRQGFTLLNNLLSRTEKKGLKDVVGRIEKKGSFASYTRKGENVAVMSSKRAERLVKRQRAYSKSRKQVVPNSFGDEIFTGKKSNRSKKVPLQQAQIDPIRSFLVSNGSSKKELLSQAEEIELSHKIQDFLALECIKESLESQIGRPPTISEWANAAEMEIGPFSKRLNEGYYSKNRMIQCNLRLVISVAKKYEGKGLSLEDLIQEGSMGLIRGCEKFDPNKGFKFCTYAYWWIRQAVMRAIFENSRLVRLPAHVVDTMLHVGRVKRLLWQKNGAPPSDGDVAKQCGISIEKLKVVTRAVKHCKSMDKPVGQDMDLHMGDILPDTSLEPPESRIARELLRADLDGVLMTLNPREEVIVRLRFGLDDGKRRTLAEIAKAFHVTRERIRQIEFRAMKKLKQPQRNECLRGMLEGGGVHISHS